MNAELLQLCVAIETARVVNEMFHLDITEDEVQDIVATIPSELEVTAEEEEAWIALARSVC